MAEKSDKARADADIVQFKLRIRESLRAQIEASASASGESMNAEIVKRLEQSFAEDRFMPSHVRGPLMAIAFDLWRIERRRDARWDEDRAIALAMGKVAGESFIFGTPMLNGEEIELRKRQFEESMAAIDRKVGYLVDLGAIVPKQEQDSPAPLDMELTATTAQANFNHPKWPAIGGVLSAKNYALAVNLTDAPENWPLMRNDNSVADEERKAAYLALMAIADDAEELFLRYEALRNAEKGEREAKEKAEEIIRDLRQG